MEQMIVSIKDGNVKVEVEGVKGARCVEMTQVVEILIGKVENRLLKKAFYVNEKVEQNLYLKQFNNDKSL